MYTSTIISTYRSVVSFIEGGGLLESLNQIGAIEYEAAKFALNNIKITNNKVAQIWSVINHLETAHTAFKNIHSSSNPFLKYVKWTTVCDSCCKDIHTCFLMIACYIYLKEYKMIPHILDSAEIAWSIIQKLTKNSTMSEWITILNPTEWKNITNSSEIDFPEQEYKKFVIKAKTYIK